MNGSSPVWVAVLVAVIVLARVLVTQSLTLVIERGKRKSGQSALVRDDIESLAKSLYDYWTFAEFTWAGKDPQSWTDPYEADWAVRESELYLWAAKLTGNGAHRKVTQALLHGIRTQSIAYTLGSR